MKRLKIGLDCDGLLGDFTSAALLVVEEVTSRKYQLSDVREFNIGRALGLSETETKAFGDVITNRRGFVSSLRPYPGARAGVRRLRELGEVFCATSPWDGSPWWQQERDSWLALHFGIDVVHHLNDKSNVDADVFVDDRDKHIRAWLGKHLGGTAVHWRTPHNLTEPTPPGAHSIGEWDDLYDVALEAARGPVQQELICDKKYTDFQGAERTCLSGGEGCGRVGCPAAHGPMGSW